MDRDRLGSSPDDAVIPHDLTVGGSLTVHGEVSANSTSDNKPEISGEWSTAEAAGKSLCEALDDVGVIVDSTTLED